MGNEKAALNRRSAFADRENAFKKVCTSSQNI
jgi:hypothetical protein